MCGPIRVENGTFVKAQVQLKSPSVQLYAGFYTKLESRALRLGPYHSSRFLFRISGPTRRAWRGRRTVF